MNGRTISLTIVGFLLGALAAAGIGVRVIEEVRTTEDATSLPPENVASTTLPPATYIIDPGETVIGSTALVPKSVSGSGSDFAIEYELVSFAPRSGVPPIQVFTFGNVTEIPNDELPFIYPRSWVLTTDNGTIEGGAANHDVRVARFKLPEGVTAADITGAEIVDPLMSFPLDIVFELSESEPSAEIFDGVSVELLNISEQTDSVIVQLEIVAQDPIDRTFFVAGVGAGWRSANFEAEGRPRVNLVWDGKDLPETMTFEAIGDRWVELVGSYPVAIGRFG